MAKENKGLIVLGITVPVLTMAVIVLGGWTYNVGQRQAVQEVLLEAASVSVEALKLDRLRAQVAAAEIKVKLDGVIERQDESKTEMKALQQQMIDHTTMQQRILDAVERRNDGN